MIEVVFFDVGDTLLRPYPSFAELFADVCRRSGRSVTTEDVQAVQERLAPHLLDIAGDAGVERGPSLSPSDSRIFWTYLYRRFLAELEIDDEALPQRLYEVFSDMTSYRLFDDVVEVLDALRRDYRLGVISNFDDWLQEMLVEFEVGPHFDTIVISGVEGVEKPDPRIYELALERAGVEPGAAAHVGDSPGMDVAPSKALGMKPVLLDRTGRYPSFADAPTVSSLKELTDLIPKL